MEMKSSVYNGEIRSEESQQFRPTPCDRIIPNPRDLFTQRQTMNGFGCRGRDEKSVTACLRCREQKLKCSRERPACARCERLNGTCSYPIPPNRRGPRTHRGPRLLNKTAERSRGQTRPRLTAIQQPYNEPLSQQTSTIEAQRHSAISRRSMTSLIGSNDIIGRNAHHYSGPEVDGASAALPTEGSVLSESYPNQLRTMSSIATEPPSISDQPPLPPTALGLSLLELYFTRVYNASLLFYRPVLLQQYIEGELHGALVRALFALATLFLQPSVSDNEKDGYAELKILSIYHSSGLPWAKTALKEATTLVVDGPSLTIIQALECLQLYWFGIGQPHRGNLCLALAYRACHLLGYSKKLPNKINASDTSLESELGRRCFWACWTSTCIVMEPEPYIKASWQEVAMVPLPGLIHNTSSGCRVTLGERMDRDWHSSVLAPRRRIDTSSGAAALLMKMVGVWAKVQLLCKDNTVSPIAQNFDMGERLSHLAASLFDAAGPLRDTCHDSNGLILLVHDSLYHQCQISIHSMVAPVFSNIPSDWNIDLVKQKKSAATVAKHADLFRRLLEPYFCGQCHVSFLPPLVGYGAFVVGIVLLAMETSCPNREANAFHAEAAEVGCKLTAAKSILDLLDSLRVYWRALQRPWEILHSALQTDFSKHLRQPRPVDIWKNHPPAQANHSEHFDDSATYNQITDISNKQLQALVDGKAEEDDLEAQHGSHLANTNDSEFEATSEIGTNDPLISQIHLPSNHDWYGLSFAESGVELFAGLEPVSLFQQGWQAFG